MPQNCWEFKKCGREADGAKSKELGVCSASAYNGPGAGLNNGKNGGRICWAVAGTLCGGKVQGTYAQKQANCIVCEFYKTVRGEEAGNFKMLLPGQKV
ncbi:MAG: hypothetical protein HZA48_01580 [Planctomycetes bacterium]|nr:hypothetical protein [Planctomycetota bacterium]